MAVLFDRAVMFCKKLVNIVFLNREHLYIYILWIKHHRSLEKYRVMHQTLFAPQHISYRFETFSSYYQNVKNR